MKKVLILLVAVIMAAVVNAQRVIPAVVLLSDYTLDGDTTLTYKYSDDYRGLIQIECASLDDVDATIGFKQKLTGFTNYVYLSDDTTSFDDGCSKYILDDADYFKGYFYDNTPGDTLRIEIKSGSVTSGTISRLSIKRYYND